MAKLNIIERENIKKDLLAGHFTQDEIMQKYNVTHNTVRDYMMKAKYESAQTAPTKTGPRASVNVSEATTDYRLLEMVISASKPTQKLIKAVLNQA